MNNTAKKILVLGFAIAIAVAGILVFYPTIVAPPTEVPVKNLHKAAIEADIERISEVAGAARNDSLYVTAVDKLALYGREDFMTDEKIDVLTKVLVQKYVPLFIRSCHAKFNASNWKESDHEAMLTRIAQLRTLKVDQGETKAVAGSYETDLRKIEQVIKDYRAAKQVAAYSWFYSVSDANAKIQQAEEYGAKSPLSNCRDLVSKLADVKVNIGNSHYRQVEATVEEMAYYRDMTEASFNALVETANRKITEYDGNRAKYGSSARTTAGLKKKANEYYKQAEDYYSVEEINISTNNAWKSMNSPSAYYRAFQSYSNYHRPNSLATMSFTIKGYETFSFYIRSYGESNYDYVMVGVGRMPTIESNYASTKGNAQSGSTIQSYKRVTINNLNKLDSYTIYVVYRKDASGDFGADKGYVLIPYENR